MTKGDPLDDFSYPTFSFMIDSYILMWLENLIYLPYSEGCGETVDVPADCCLGNQYQNLMYWEFFQLLSTGSTHEDPSRHDWKIVDWNIKI